MADTEAGLRQEVRPALRRTGSQPRPEDQTPAAAIFGLNIAWTGFHAESAVDLAAGSCCGLLVLQAIHASFGAHLLGSRSE